MREILFRGKTKAHHRDDGGYWLYGDLVQLVRNERLVFMYNELEILEEIDPETVGQYTGLKDKNGKRIFEGDIVQWKDENFNNYTSVVEWCGEKWNYPAFDLAKHDYECNGLQYVHEDCIIEVIGTIYDNPELLEMKK